MNQAIKLKSMTIAGLLCAVGIIIPMFAPKIVMEPASFTLASHVSIFIAMFISPPIAISVALITSVGFFIAGFPLIIVLRALTHLVFATLGAFILKKNGNMLLSKKSITIFSLFISFVHALCEVMVVSIFYWGNNMSSTYYDKGYLLAVIGLVGLGTMIHSMIDFSIAVFVWKPLQSIITIPANAKVRVK